MPQLPNPDLVKRRSLTPAGPAGLLTPVNINAPGPDTAIGDALTDVSNDAYKFMMREKARMDEVAVDDAKNQYLQKALELEGEYAQIKGKNAVDQDIVKDYTTKLDTISEEISPNFKNNTQRKAWESYYGKSKVRFTAGVMKHKLNESDRYASDTHAALISTNTQVAHSNPYDDGVVNTSAAAIVESIAKEKVRAGWGDDKTEVELRKALSPFWGGVAAKFINDGKYDEAADILAKHQNIIDPEMHDDYQKAITVGKIITDVRGKHPTDFDTQEDLVKKRKDIDESTKQTIIGLVRSDQAEHDRREFEAKKERRTAASNSYWSALGNNNYGTAQEIAKGFDVDGGDFTEQERQAAIARTQQTVNKTDEYKWRELRWDILRGKFKDPKDLWVDKRASSITNEDMMKLEGLIKPDAANYADVLADVEYAFKSMYSDDPDQGLKFMAFQRGFLEAIDDAEDKKDADLTSSEVYGLAMSMLEDRVKVRKKWFDKKIPSIFEEDFESRNDPETAEEKTATSADMKLKSSHTPVNDPAGIR